MCVCGVFFGKKFFEGIIFVVRKKLFLEFLMRFFRGDVEIFVSDGVLLW